MRQGTRGALLAAVLAGLMIIEGTTGQATAATCAAEAVSARGDFSRFEWSAQAKARATWRRKVRLTTNLGTPYSDWQRAQNKEVRCIKSERSVYCIISATPCRG